MKIAPILVLAPVTWLLASSARAEPEPRAVPGETIVVHDRLPVPKAPPIPPRPIKNPRIAPRYSDAAIEQDVWVTAWLLLDVNQAGVVTRVKFLRRPGHDLDTIAVTQALRTRFDPAEDGHGNPVRTLLVWPIEWPSYWWMVTMTGLVTRIPPTVAKVPCAGTAPLNLESAHPTLRDCSLPDLTKAEREPWIEARTAK